MADKNQVRYRKLVQQYMASGAPPDMVGRWGEMAANVYGQFMDTKALLKYQRGEITSQGRTQRSDIRQQGKFDIQSSAGAALERGVLGSSTDAEARAQIAAATGAQVSASRAGTSSALTQNLAQLMQSRRDYQSNLMALQQQRAGAQAMGASDRYLQGLLDSMTAGAPGGGGGGGQGGGGAGGGGGLDARIGDKRQLISKLLKRLDATAEGPIGGDTADRMENIEDRLYKVWRRRNVLLRKSGEDPRARAILERRIREAKVATGPHPA